MIRRFLDEFVSDFSSGSFFRCSAHKVLVRASTFVLQIEIKKNKTGGVGDGVPGGA